MALLDIGELSVRVGNQRRYLSVSGGFAEVLRHRVSILAETSELSDEIDLDRAQRARHEAEKQLKLDLSEHQFRRAEVRLKKAISRIQVHGRAGH